MATTYTLRTPPVRLTDDRSHSALNELDVAHAKRGPSCGAVVLAHHAGAGSISRGEAATSISTVRR